MKRYYNLEIVKTISVTGLKTIEKISLDKNFYYPVETHDFYEFIYVLSGNIICEEKNDRINLSGDEFKLINPKTTHRYFTGNSAEIFIICFKCKSSILPALDQPVFLDNKEKTIINKLISEVEHSFEFPFKERVILKKNAPIGAEQITENYIEELIISLLRRQAENNNLQTVENKSELQINIVKDIISILTDNIYNSISLKDICKKLYYSNTYLNNIFKKHKKTTIMHYYNILKAEESKKLLRNGMSIPEISNALHFDNPNYFSKTFKKTVKLTPSQYKQIHCK